MRTGDIYIDPSYLTNRILNPSLLGLETEELFHFQDIHKLGLLDQPERELQYLIPALEDQVDRRLILNGFKGDN